MIRAVLMALLFAASAEAPALAQDGAQGEKDFAVCKACHQIGPNAKNAVGLS